MKTNHSRSLPLAVALALALAPAVVRADDSAALADLMKEVKALREEVTALKAAQAITIAAATNTASPVASAPADTTADTSSLLGPDFMKVKGLTIGFYGESKYRIPEAGADVFDAHRYVLTPSYQINDWLVFNSEFELEHGGVDESTARGSRFNGELELEQMYVDILINDHFNIRSLGIDLVPVGRINQIHEPTTFYSTERPELYREIIPTTWMEPSMSVFGKIVDGLDYRLMVSAGLEDRIASAPTAAGVTATSGLRNARPRLRQADESRLAVSGKLHFNGITGLDASTSFYHSQLDGFNQQDVTMTLWDIEAQYRVPGTGLELRGDFAMWFINDAQNLIANNTGTATDDIGERMYGWYAEAAYHFWPEAWRDGKGKEMDFVPFVRYSSIATQSEMLPGSAKLNDGNANRDFLTVGAAYFLNPNFVIKADYRLNLDDTAATAASAASQDYVQLGVGMAF
jgi:hypothetical protein